MSADNIKGERMKRRLSYLSSIMGIALFTLLIIQDIWAWVATGGWLCGQYSIYPFVALLLTYLVGLFFAVKVLMLERGSNVGISRGVRYRWNEESPDE